VLLPPGSGRAVARGAAWGRLERRERRFSFGVGRSARDGVRRPSTSEQFQQKLETFALAKLRKNRDIEHFE